MTMCRLVVSPPARHQPPVGSKKRKQVITPDLQRLRCSMEQMMQFARTNSGLAQADVIHSGQNLVLMCCAPFFTLRGLIPRLTTYPKETTGPADVQTGYAGLREDLPGRFFTSETP